MLASFSSTEAGCDQCAPFDTAFNSPVNNVSNTGNQYSQQLNNMNHQNNVMQSNSVGYNQNNINNLNQNLTNLPPPVNTYQQPTQPQHSNSQLAMQKMVQKAVQKPNIHSVASPAPTQPQGKYVNKNNTVEPFTSGQSPVQVNIPSRLILTNLATVILVSLALNETCKYYINRSLQMADGSPHYYAFYSLFVLVLAGVVYYGSTRLIN